MVLPVPRFFAVASRRETAVGFPGLAAPPHYPGSSANSRPRTRGREFWRRRVALSLAASALVAWSLPFVSLANELPAAEGQYAISTWKNKDGLPAERLRHLLCDADGFLWISTFNGLARFDGVRFKTYEVASTPGISDNLINALFQDRSGRLWLGHETGGVTVFENGRFRPLFLDRSWVGSPVDRIVQRRDGAVWILNRRGTLLPIKGDEIGKVVTGIEGIPVSVLAADTEGELWATAGQKVYRFDGQKFTLQLEAPGRVPLHIFAARSGGLWIPGPTAVRRWHHGAWTGDTIPTELGSRSRTTEWVEVAKGQVAVRTFDDGLHLLGTNRAPLHITTKDGLPSDHISALTEDAEGNIWIGVGDRGLSRLAPRSVQIFAPPDGWLGRAVHAVTQGRDGSLWAATEGAGIYRLKNGLWTRFDERSGVTNPVVKTLLETGQGRILAGLASGGVLEFKEDRFEPLLLGASLPHPTALFEDSGKRLWAGGLTGAVVVGQDSPVAQPVTRADTFSLVTCFAESKDGTVWIGSLGFGLGVYRDKRFTVIRREAGLPSDYVWCLHTSTDGTLWIGTYDRGLVRYREGRFAVISAAHGLPGNMVGQIVEDESGALWIGTNGGIARVTRDGLDRCADGQTTRIDAAVYDLSDGLTTLGLSGGVQSAAGRARDGALWFATNSGLARIDPRQLRPPRPVPPVLIESIRIDGAETPLAGPPSDRVITVPPGSRRVEFDYTAASLNSPYRIRFRYLLEGADRQWNEVDSRRTAYFSYLRPGDYTLRVRLASENDGAEGREAAVRIQVVPYFWETTWFAVMVGASAFLMCGAVLLLFLRNRHRKRLAQLERAQAIERDRTRIAHDLHDEIGSGLTQLSILSHSAIAAATNPEKVTSRLREIESATSVMTEAIDEIVWAVNPRHDSLESLLAYLGRTVQEFGRRAGHQVHIDIPLDLAPLEVTAEERHELYLVMREALHNTAKHANASIIWFSVRREQDVYVFQLDDNGRGFPRESPRIAAQRVGVGLESIRCRMERIGGAVSWSNRPEGGARLVFRVTWGKRRRT